MLAEVCRAGGLRVVKQHLKEGKALQTERVGGWLGRVVAEIPYRQRRPAIRGSTEFRQPLVDVIEHRLSFERIPTIANRQRE